MYLEFYRDGIEAMGATLLKDQLPQVKDLVNNVLGYSIACYQKGDEDEEDEENDSKIFSDTLNFLVEVATQLGQEADETIYSLCPMIENAMNKGGIYEFEETFGHFCDIFEVSPTIIPLMANRIVELIINSREMRDEAVSRNGAFCLGLMFEMNPEFMVGNGFVVQALNHLQTLQAEANLDVLKDNILSACAKIYTVDTSKSVPADILMSQI